MKLLIQRVLSAQVNVDKQLTASIDKGLLVFVGFTHDDTVKQVDWCTKKLLSLRIFTDHQGKMNHSILDIEGDILLISQFTLYGNCIKGARPSFTQAAAPHIAIPLYEQCVAQLKQSECNVRTGIFGSKMEVSLTNDGPVTFLIEK